MFQMATFYHVNKHFFVSMSIKRVYKHSVNFYLNVHFGHRAENCCVFYRQPVGTRMVEYNGIGDTVCQPVQPKRHQRAYWTG